MPERVLVTGAGGFIGHHLVNYLLEKGYWVRGVDIKRPEFETARADEFKLMDLRQYDNCLAATDGVHEVYNLAADMGGIGYITASHADIARNNVLLNVNMLEAGRANRVSRFLFSSSACIYPAYKQREAAVTPLKEEDAYPAEAEEGYGWEKLFMEKMCQYYSEDHGLETRVVRFHNVYGPMGTWEGGKEKAPAALSRKIALAKDGDTIEVWGDGKQTRSFMYIEDCVEGIYRIMRSDHRSPLNLGNDRLVSIDELVHLISRVAGKRIRIKHDLSKPQGVRGRNSDNTRLRELFGWEPSTPLEVGLKETYWWIHGELAKQGRLPVAV